MAKISTLPNVTVEKANDGATKPSSLDEIDRIIQRVQQRAFSLYMERGATPGHAMDDWLQAEREALCAPPSELVENDKRYELQVAVPGLETKRHQDSPQLPNP